MNKPGISAELYRLTHDSLLYFLRCEFPNHILLLSKSCICLLKNILNRLQVAYIPPELTTHVSREGVLGFNILQNIGLGLQGFQTKQSRLLILIQ